MVWCLGFPQLLHIYLQLLHIYLQLLHIYLQHGVACTMV